ncbi:pentatricopeptide repeat-containing protein At4g02750 [Selaginella moellendorffii]|uniref:pentatricopeptide repeat-containing protein At4g02750 n=1 Tax=Selaginella moellendorffii TaxID=88036 RepID=UPI000D1CF0D5|nr:pentatricopeptide repeat-containing protein At4g02750 [Selaginella moellendorffii]|eukprot:XP_024516767.1 pentatricopeptide repeat-containing protein At4g02750 [Selaginella moellendorffii]
MPMYDQVSWNAMLAAYAVHGHLQKMKDLFSKMPVKDSVSCNTVLAALGDRGLVNDARCLFDEMTNRDIVSWTCLLQANASREENQEFLAIRDKMPAWNSVSNLATLQKHIQISQLEAAKNAFDSLAEIRSVAAWTAMVGGYGDSGHLGAATAIFHKMPQWSIVSWTALLRAHARDSAAAARKIFVAMPGKNIASWNAMLAASAQSFESSDLLLHRMPAWDLITLTAAVAIFSQSGHIDRARVFFDAMPEKDPASWNAMVAAYGRRPGGAAALDLFQEMLLEGVAADATTIKSVLAALSHGGDSRAACCCFASIASGDFAGTIDSPSHDHYSSVIDVLARCGRLGDAQELLKAMPFPGDAAARVSLMAACRTHEDVARGVVVARDLLRIDGDSSSSWLSLLANMVKP